MKQQISEKKEVLREWRDFVRNVYKKSKIFGGVTGVLINGMLCVKSRRREYAALVIVT